MLTPESGFGEGGDDWVSDGIDDLSDEIIRLWPAYTDRVNDILNAPELTQKACYRELSDLHGGVIDSIEGSWEEISPWQSTVRTIFHQLSDNDNVSYRRVAVNQDTYTRAQKLKKVWKMTGTVMLVAGLTMRGHYSPDMPFKRTDSTEQTE